MKMEKEDIIRQVFKPILNKGFNVFFIGGCVRDELLGVTPHDFDIVTNATPQQLHDIFPTFSKKSINSEKYGITIPLIKLKDDYIYQEIEIATFRMEGMGRHPSIEFAQTIEQDCLRRDFTINALYEDISGNIFDPTFEGKRDLSQKMLKFVGHHPVDRLQEDPLRAFRFVRFLSQKGYTSYYSIEELEKFTTQFDFKEVSKERQLLELKQILAGKYFTKPVAWDSFFALGVAKEIGIDDLRIKMQGVRQSYKWHAEGSLWVKDDQMAHFEDFNIKWDCGNPIGIEALKGWAPVANGNVWDHTELVVKKASELLWKDDKSQFNEQDRFEIVLGAFLHDIGKAYMDVWNFSQKEYTLLDGDISIVENIPVVHDHDKTGVSFAKQFCKNLKMTNKEIQNITNMVKYHMTIHSLLNKTTFEKRKILNLPNFNQLSIIGLADDAGSLNLVPNERGTMEVILKDANIKALQTLGPIQPPILTGDDLIKAGFKPTTLYSKVLKAVWENQINVGITDKKVLLKIAKKIFKDDNRLWVPETKWEKLGTNPDAIAILS